MARSDRVGESSGPAHSFRWSRGRGLSRPGEENGDAQPGFRYPAVLVLMLLAVILLVAAPSAAWSSALAVAIEGCALVLTIATSREREPVRRRRALTAGVFVGITVILVWSGIAPRWFTAIAALVVTVGIPVALTRGLLRLLRLHGVTLNAVAGSLAIYLSTGLIFAWMVALVAQLSSVPYFAQHTNGTEGDKVYFSFTVLTTTGFGDFTPATPAGHALAVIEMLTGQIYLVTVIGLLIGNFAGNRRNAPSQEG